MGGEKYTFTVQDPPPKQDKGAVGFQKKAVAFMTANAGQWCRIQTKPIKDSGKMYSFANSWKVSGKCPNCEFTCRTEGQEVVMYGRYMPPAGEGN